MNSASRFSLTCDELVQSIKLNNRRRAYELVERLRETFTVAVYGRPKDEPRPHPPADRKPLDCFGESRHD